MQHYPIAGTIAPRAQAQLSTIIWTQLQYVEVGSAVIVLKAYNKEDTLRLIKLTLKSYILP